METADKTMRLDLDGVWAYDADDLQVNHSKSGGRFLRSWWLGRYGQFGPLGKYPPQLQTCVTARRRLEPAAALVCQP